MKEIVELLRSNGMLFKRLEPVDKKLLGTRRKVDIYEAVDLHSNYTAIFFLRQKSRFLRKHADDMESLLEKLKIMQDHNYKKKLLLYDMPFCSKAQALMKERGWRLINVAA